ncbi:MAG: substrate-binding domain-containing protein [Actinomycetota bacterium]|nr:substrate-binding domain-containing protein [Actinomycetota bacterium]MDP1878557.1 substrate-binding domain-containing protein [Actinomycetota bacterium]
MKSGKKSLVGVAAVGALLLAGCATPTSTAESSAEGQEPAASAAASESAAPAESAEPADEGYVSTTGTTDQLLPDITSLCGDKPMVVALADGFGGNSWRKITRAEFEDEAAKCPNITQVLYTDAQADPQKAISDFNGLVAQGANVIITFADSAEALLPAVKAATEAGVQVVPYVAGPGGTPGEDYTAFVAEDVKAYGRALADWTIKQMGGEGNLVMLGGTAGNGYSQAVFDGVLEAVNENPGVTLLNKDDGFAVTNWEPGETQKVVAGLITKYGQIDGIVSDYGGGSVGGIRAFQAADKPIPPWSANDSNEFACLWYDNKDANPDYQIATISSRTWISRVALRRAVAAYQGIDDPEPMILSLPLSEDSTEQDAAAPVCNADLPPDAILSSQLSAEQLTALFQ